ncbi:MAG: hypothetical protein AAF560_04965 [Acidobacteriota bacterium]
MLKKLVLFVLLIALAIGGAIFYLGNQATDVPEWFDPEASLAELSDDAALTETLAHLGDRARGLAPAAAETKAAPPPVASSEPQPYGTPDPPAAPPSSPEPDTSASAAQTAQPAVALDEPQLNALLQRGLEARSEGRRARQATKVIQANLLEDRMAVGGVTNVEKLMSAAESERERALIQRLTRLAPFIQGRDFYLGVEGRPVARQGKLAFDGLTLKVGQLSFDPQELAERFGLEDKLAEQEMAVALPDLPLEDVRIEDEQLLLTLAR